MAAMSTIAIGMAVGAVIGGGAAAIQSGGDFNAIWKGALVGGVAGGIGGWAAPALAPATWGATAVGALGGGIAGVSGGLLNAAINGGTGEDYWKGALFGGLGGAATGALTGSLSSSLGGETTGINPVTGEAVPVGTPEITPLSDAGAPAMSLSSPVASSVGGSNIDAASAIDASVVGQSAPAVATANPTLSDVSSFGGSFNTADPSFSFDSYANNAYKYNPTVNTSPFSADASGIPTTASGQYAFDDAVQSTPMGTTELANSPSFQAKSLGADLGMDTFGFGKNASNSGFSMDKLFNWDTAKSLGKGAMISQGLKGVGAFLGQKEAQQNQQQLMDLYNLQKNQYQQQNAAANAYQNQLSETYSNPDAYLNSPEALASRQLAMQKLLAQNAAAGRRTAGLPMQNQLMMNQLANLQNYRQGLRSAATGAYASPTGLGTTLSAAQAQNPTGNLMAGLGSIFAPPAAYYLIG